MKHCSLLWLLVFLLLHWPSAARATAGPPATGRPLAEALNSDGTLRAGAAGSFDARAFRMGTGPDGQPVFRPAGALGAGDERWADGFGMSNGVDGTINVVVQSGTGTYVGGNFTLAGGAVVNSVAKWNGTAWSSLGGGVNGSVYALAVASSGEVYVGGNLIQAGGIAVNRVAKWNGTAWSSLGTGLTGGSNNFGNIVALAVASSGEVYVGGEFTQAGGVAANNVAKWNGTAWSSLGTGVGYFGSLVVASSGEVYVGGYFSQAGGVAANNVAKWNGTAWSSLGSGVNGNVRALAVASTGEVYVGGDFTQAGGVAANSVAKWNGTAWSSLGTGITGTMSIAGNVYTLAVASSGEVYVGGAFYQAGGVAVNSAAKWNGTAWSGVGTGTGNGLNGNVYALAVASSGEVYVGGIINQAGGVAVNNVAKWNGTAWSSLGSGVNGNVKALAVASSGAVYVCGEFTQAGGVAANNVAKWNGAAWSSLGTGIKGFGEHFDALAVTSSGEVYVGGSFRQVGGVAANGVAKWNGTAWSSLGTGVNGSVNALALASSGEVYVGGYFTQAGGVAANRVAKWNGLNWSSLGTGVNFYVFQLATGPTNQLYAGGNFTKTGDGGKAMARFAIYDPAAPLATAATRVTPAALFPNPAHGTATLRLPAGAARLPLTLTDALGRTVRQFPAPAGPEAVLDLRGLPAGVYLVRCGELTQRLVVE